MLAPSLKRSLGIGNATGLGMAPFVVSHPELLHHWFHARESALARVRSMEDISPDDVKRALELQQRAYQHVCEWQTSDADYRQRNQELLQDLLEIRHWLERVCRACFRYPIYLQASGEFDVTGTIKYEVGFFAQGFSDPDDHGDAIWCMLKVLWSNANSDGAAALQGRRCTA